MSRYPKDIEAIAEAWASIDGKLAAFWACRDDVRMEDRLGRYDGYCTEAEELKKRLLARGYAVIPLPGTEITTADTPKQPSVNTGSQQSATSPCTGDVDN